MSLFILKGLEKAQEYLEEAVKNWFRQIIGKLRKSKWMRDVELYNKCVNDVSKGEII